MRKDIDKFSPETRSIIRAQVTRRSLLVGAGAIAGASTLAACGTGSTESGADGIVDVSDSEKIVRWATGHFTLITTRIPRSIQRLKHLRQLMELPLHTLKILTITTPSMEKSKVN